MKTHITLFYFLLFLLSSNISFGQEGDKGQSGSKGKITGIVFDANSNKPVEFATVALLRTTDSSIVTGAVTLDDGTFSIEQVNTGQYLLRIKFIGYTQKTISNINISPKSPIFNTGIIKISQDAKVLKEIDVTAEKAIFQNSIDKKVFNVDKSIVSQGGSASDVLQQVPSVSVDIDGNISMRGSGNVTVLIDGKPSSLTGSSRAAILEQIPASTIESVELITNPSAKYDPDGMAGIINIILKKNRAPGFNGNVTVSAGTGFKHDSSAYRANENTLNKYNISTNLSYHTQKLNISGNYAYRYNERYGMGYSDRHTFRQSDSSVMIKNSRLFTTGESHMGKLNLDYQFNDKNSISLGGVYNHNTNAHPEANIYDFYQLHKTDSTYKNSYGRNSGEPSTSQSIDATIDYKKTFKKPLEQWTINLAYSGSMGNDSNYNNQRNYTSPLNGSSPTKGDTAALTSNNSKNQNHIITIQSDFILPMQGQSKLEFGYKSVLRRMDNNFTAHYQNFYPNNTDDGWKNDKTLINEFRYSEDVHSVYGMFSKTINSFSLQAGSRFEQSYITPELVTTGAKYSSSVFNVYPSIHLSEKISTDQEYQMSYSRRVNRPGFNSLNPFTDRSDPLNIRIGNPFLRPEYVNNYELAYSKNWEQNSLTSSVYYKDIHGVNKMKRDTVGKDVTVTTSYNLGTGISYGFELIGRVVLAKWWNITANTNLYRTILHNTGGDAGNINTDNYSGIGKFTSNMTLWKGLQLQISGNYNGPSYFPGGHIAGIYYLDAGLRKEIMKGKAVVSLTGNDLFNQRRYIIYSSGDGFQQYDNRKRESRMAMINFTYKFGKSDLGAKKKEKRDDNKNEGGGEDF